MEDDYTSIEDYLSNEVYVTQTSDFDDRLHDALVPEVRGHPLEQLHFLYTYNTVIVVMGIILNLVLIKGIITAKSTGALFFVLQIAIVDVLTLIMSNWEFHYHFTRTWTLSAEQCRLYSGLESFTSVAIAYFIIGLNFHSISTYNLAVNLSKNAITTTEHDSVGESFAEENSYEVTADVISQKRSLTIDYRYKKTHISVLFPILLVWFIAASESLPLFLFSDIVLATQAPAFGGAGNQTKHCTVLVNTVTNHRIVSLMVILIRIVLPIVAVLITTVQIVVKFYKGKRFTQPDEIDENVAFALKLSIFLSISYVIFTVQRLYGSLLLEILSEPNVVPKYPLFSSTVGLTLAVLHYSASFIRPLIIVVMCKQRNNHVDIAFLCRKRPTNNTISLE